MQAPREADILVACLALLRLYRIPAWRQNQGGVSRAGRDGRTHYYRFAGAEGISDIIGLLPPAGRLLAVEVKRPGNRPTAAQRAFLDAVASAGGLSLVVDDVCQLEAALRREGVIR